MTFSNEDCKILKKNMIFKGVKNWIKFKKLNFLGLIENKYSYPVYCSRAFGALNLFQ
jgi:hypothetical protein